MPARRELVSHPIHLSFSPWLRHWQEQRRDAEGIPRRRSTKDAAVRAAGFQHSLWGSDSSNSESESASQPRLRLEWNTWQYALRSRCLEAAVQTAAGSGECSSWESYHSGEPSGRQRSLRRGVLWNDDDAPLCDLERSLRLSS